ncbi:hypothetical protein WAI453_007534 [Rhynchosporium graminicola]
MDSRGEASSARPAVLPTSNGVPELERNSGLPLFPCGCKSKKETFKTRLAYSGYTKFPLDILPRRLPTTLSTF